MNQPAWYKDFEGWLLAHGKPFIVGALVAVAGISLYFAWEVAHDRKAVPAAAWATYMWMP